MRVHVGCCGNKVARAFWGDAPQKTVKSRSLEIQFPAFWATKLAWLWHVNVTVTQVEFRTLGKVTKFLQRNLQQIGVHVR